jgi:hypothetical protein
MDQAQMDFENEGGETYICGNPPYKGGTEQTEDQKSDMAAVFSERIESWKSLDYVCGWFAKFALYAKSTPSRCAFVCTNSISQGEQVARLWPFIFSLGQEIIFAHSSFKWSNLASHKAAVIVVIIGLGVKRGTVTLYEGSDVLTHTRREVDNICPYLVPYRNIVINASSMALSPVSAMMNGNKPADGGHLLMDFDEAETLCRNNTHAENYIRRCVGAQDSIQGWLRFCLWIRDDHSVQAAVIEAIAEKIDRVREIRLLSRKKLTRAGASRPHAFQQVRQTGNEIAIIIPRHSSETREFLPISLYPPGTIVADSAFAIYDAPLWNFAIISARTHLIWVAAVCGKIKTDYRYSSTLGWNTFPVPTLTEKNRTDLTRCAQDILLAREAHFPATIAELYDPDAMPAELREAHERNDETLERIYIGRRFKNDTERLEKLFELYTKMTIGQTPARAKRSRKSA